MRTFTILFSSLLLSLATAKPFVFQPSFQPQGRHQHNHHSRRQLQPQPDSILDQEALDEAHQRDDTATRSFSNIQIQDSQGRCLFVDPESGDFRANLTPVQVAECSSTDGQGWDVITEGVHNDQEGSVLIVSTLTQACLNVDPRRDPGSQVRLFSCGGRADGGGEVTDSQLFSIGEEDPETGAVTLSPQNGQGLCLTSGDAEAVDIAQCDGSTPEQQFIIAE